MPKVQIPHSRFDVSILNCDSSIVDVQSSIVDVDSSIVDDDSSIVDVESSIVDVESSIVDVESSQIYHVVLLVTTKKCTLATASTCDLVLRLPTCHSAYEDFKGKMILSFGGHGGFGFI